MSHRMITSIVRLFCTIITSRTTPHFGVPFSVALPATPLMTLNRRGATIGALVPLTAEGR